MSLYPSKPPSDNPERTIGIRVWDASEFELREIPIPTLDLTTFAIAAREHREPCPTKANTGVRCYHKYADPFDWCESCLGDHKPANGLPEWMGGRIDSEPFQPSPEDQAEALGYEVATAENRLGQPTDWPVEIMEAFQRGYDAAQRDLYLAKQVSHAIDRVDAGLDDHDQSEMIEALGTLAARQMGA